MNKYLEQGHAEIASEDSKNRIWYLPHHPVYHPRKPGKLRTVFDCAEKFGNVSLNDNILSGPDLSNTLLGVLLRFRRFSIAITPDIDAMFHQVRIPKIERNFFRFLWWPKGNLNAEPQEYRMTVHLFGATTSPSCALFALKEAIRCGASYCNKITITTAKEQFYVDDILINLPIIEEFKLVMNEIKILLKKGGFSLTKWTSNRLELIEGVSIDERAMPINDVGFKGNQIQRTLEWDVTNDIFEFNVRPIEQTMTRRKLLSFIACLLDPMGFIAPILLVPKLILQETCRRKLKWDDILPEECNRKWIEWSNKLFQVHSIKINRGLLPKEYMPCVERQLHGFANASENAYGVCIYLRSQCSNKEVHCSLLFSKARVGPIKALTISKMELTAASLCAKLMTQIKEELKMPINSIHFWTDSTVVLHCIRNTHKRFETFVANHLAIIRAHSDFNQWRYVNINDNPSDYVSRGLLASDEKKWYKWFNGPMFLHAVDIVWQNDQMEEPLELKGMGIIEKRRIMNTIIKHDPFLEYLSKFSSWIKLVKTNGWCLRFIKNTNSKIQAENSIHGYLTLFEVERSQEIILKLVQRSVFYKEMTLLSEVETFNHKDKLNGQPVVLVEDIFNKSVIENDIHLELKKAGKRMRKPLARMSPLRKLNPFMYKGLSRVGGRLQQCPLPFNIRHPLILPNNHFVTDLIINEFHINNGHSGLSHVFADLRERFWILRCHSAIRRVINKCIICKTIHARPCKQMMAQLPISRMEYGSCPFNSVAIDNFRPFYIKKGRS